MKQILSMSLSLSLMVLFSCVGPEEPVDGLIDNLPSIVNTKTAFTFALRGERYAIDETYTLELTADTSQTITTTLMVTDTPTRQDTSVIRIYNKDNDVLAAYDMAKDQVVVESTIADSLQHLVPKKVRITSDKYSGIVNLVIAREKEAD